MKMFLPLFPLEIVVFPDETLPLHIFEPRYKQLIGDCRDEGIAFGIPPVLDGNPARFGTRLKLDQIIRNYDSGEMDILTRGLEVFQLVAFQTEVPGKLYSGGEVKLVENDSACEQPLQEEVVRLFNELQRVIRSNRRLEPGDRKNLSFRLGHHVGLGLIQKVELLSMPHEHDRLIYLRDHLTTAVPQLEENLAARKKIGGNGHMKDFPRSD